MTKQNVIKIFEEKKVRTLWDSETEVVFLYRRCNSRIDG